MSAVLIFYKWALNYWWWWSDDDDDVARSIWSVIGIILLSVRLFVCNEVYCG